MILIVTRQQVKTKKHLFTAIYMIRICNFYSTAIYRELIVRHRKIKYVKVCTETIYNKRTSGEIL